MYIQRGHAMVTYLKRVPNGTRLQWMRFKHLLKMALLNWFSCLLDERQLVVVGCSRSSAMQMVQLSIIKLGVVVQGFAQRPGYDYTETFLPLLNGLLFELFLLLLPLKTLN